ncbi:uncharacterized protein LOC110807464 [Carica papaya]|uniref:uncharacterized protein LOC110807464 n=1 Tax=Carica papaya TaxID=3649 RepID=UPI000B8C9C52|nr:uncharacterized protein LOC110807464 [Carica papaya]
MNDEKGEEEDERREVAIASLPSLTPNLKPAGVTHDQLSKFRELHRRRLQIKSKSKIHKKTKDRTSQCHGKDLITEKIEDNNSSIETEYSCGPGLRNNSANDCCSITMNNKAPPLASKKPQKLHWGLDTKERWERKANM